MKKTNGSLIDSNNSSKHTDSNNSPKSSSILTPRTLRLLKLIEDGTADHARIAATQLSEFTANCSPLILWEILGRLQAFLESKEWNTRSNAGLAMEGVAKHLPVTDQEAFLSQDHRYYPNYSDEKNDHCGEGLTSLTIHDLEGNISKILKEGRLLNSYAESRYQNEEDDALEHLNQSCRGSEDFCKTRLEMQRRILTIRLGLSNILADCTVDHNQLGSQLIGKKDIESLTESSDDPRVSTKDSSSCNDRRPVKKQKRDHKNSKARVSIGTLLTMQIQQQTQQTISHRSAQALLAGELMFRIFDPNWHIRHGSLIGILALVRAWKTHQRKYKDVLFGVWPHDILARSLCCLALDRFGDYSGVSAEAVAGGMVAPVREMAGQVFAAVFIMTPQSLKQKVRNLLNELLRHDEWETRHGALLAIKYAAPLMMKAKESNENYREGNFMDFFADQIISRLEDRNDDVQGVASQILTYSLDYINTNKVHDIDFLHRICRSLWKSLVNMRVVSSSIHDVVKLFSGLIRRNATEVLKVISNGESFLFCLVQIFSRMSELLECELVSVKISILHVIEQLSHEVVKQMQPSTRSEVDKTKARICFCSVAKNVHSLCCATSSELEKEIDDNNNEISDLENLNHASLETWTILSEISNSVVCDSISIQNELIFDLSKRYFDFRSTQNMKRGLSMRARLDHAAILSRFLLLYMKAGVATSFESRKMQHDILEFFLLSCIDSPFIFHFEAACFFIQTHLSCIKDQKLLCETRIHLTKILEQCLTKLSNMLIVSSQLNKKSNFIRHEAKTLKMVTDSFDVGYTMICKEQSSGEDAAAAIVDLWGKAGLFPNDNSMSHVTIDFIRLTSHIAGTLIAGGTKFFPTKLTPIVRPLMTSIKHESGEYQKLACSHMETFLLALMNESSTSERYDGFRKTFHKVLTNLCQLVIQDKKPGCVSASIVIGLLVSKLQHGRTLQDILPVWNSLLPLRGSFMDDNYTEKINAMQFVKAICLSLHENQSMMSTIVDNFAPSLVNLACSEHLALSKSSCKIIQGLCSIDPSLVLDNILPLVILFLQDHKNDTKRRGACLLLSDVLDTTKGTTTLCPYVRALLPIVMSMMIDPVKVCAEIAAKTFSILVRLAPLVNESAELMGTQTSEEANLVIDHLINGKKLLPCEIHPEVTKALSEGNITLRNYQLEGISWLRFLQRVNLNGALCDSMGLGKTLQAIIGISLAHKDNVNSEIDAKSLVVCPSSIVGHWVNEIERYFSRNSIFRVLAFIGNSQQRKLLLERELETCNLVVTSYEVLRNEIQSLSRVEWMYCVLDEGHLLKNPKTATARASRQLRARHKLILTGTPIQNSVNEIWATFDFLMPNFLGSSSQFSKEFSRPIVKGQSLDAAAADIADGIEKLKLLHQQILPFILRREKEQVLKELPPKIITRIPCTMSAIQEDLYRQFCSNQQGRQLISMLNEIVNTQSQATQKNCSASKPNVLKSLLYLRLLCTHPWLVRTKVESRNAPTQSNLYDLEASGKLVALRELLRDAGIYVQNLTAADNDSSLLYCDGEEEQGSDVDDDQKVLEPDYQGSNNNDRQYLSNMNGSRCLIFAQFTHSLDIVEELLIKRHMPSVKYLRLDGKVPVSKRSDVVDRFNQDESFKVLLLTTKIGGLGLNLTGADTVIFLEHDWNPHSDLQAMDRAHRIGQKRTVNVYQLVTMNSIEEKTMLLQERKLAMSKAIVNTDNSSMYSMGTDRLLDIFQFRTDSSTTSTKKGRPNSELDDALDVLVDRYQEEYQSLSLPEFLAGFENK